MTKNLIIKLANFIKSPVIKTKILTIKDCKEIFNEASANKLKPSLVFTEESMSLFNLSIRKSQSTDIVNQILFEKIFKKVSLVTKNHWGIELKGKIKKGQYAEYTFGDFFDWHVDNYLHTKHQQIKRDKRTFTVIIMLTSQLDFKGGELLIKDPFNNVITYDHLSPGEAVIFPSFMLHKVSKIKSGKRATLTLWLNENELIIV